MVNQKQESSKTSDKPISKAKVKKPKVEFVFDPNQELVKALKPAFDAIGKRMDQMDKRITQASQRTNTVAKKASEEPPKTNPVDIFKTVNEILQSPIVQKVVDGIFGGSEEAAAPAEQASIMNPTMQEDAKEYRKFASGMIKAALDTANARAKKLMLENKEKSMLMESDVG